MKFIAHRGNVKGPSSSENSPAQIDVCLNESIDCEVDLWVQNGIHLLGHNFGQHQISLDWLLERKHGLWIHCKNSEALATLNQLKNLSLNFFWHQDDAYTITSKNVVWVYPGEYVVPGSISVLPEKWLTKDRHEEISRSYGICTDYVLEFRAKFEG